MSGVDWNNEAQIEAMWDITPYMAEQIASNDAPHALLNLLSKQLAQVVNFERQVEAASDELQVRREKLEESQRTFDAIRGKAISLVPEIGTGYTTKLKETVIFGPNGPTVVPVPEEC